MKDQNSNTIPTFDTLPTDGGSSFGAGGEHMDDGSYIDLERLQPEERKELAFFQFSEAFRIEDEKHSAVVKAKGTNMAKGCAAKVKALKQELISNAASLEMECIAEQAVLKNERAKTLISRIRSVGVEAARRQNVPAYTFERFRELPLEIRLHIWEIAVRAIPSTLKRYFVDMDRDDEDMSRNYDQSSRIYSDDHDFAETNTLLLACSESREICQKMFIRMSVQLPAASNSARYISPMDDFYILGNRWYMFKIIIDILNKSISEPSPPVLIQNGLKGFASIRYLTVEFNIFAEVPASIWAHFSQLQKLTIGFYPYQSVSQEDGRFEEFRERYGLRSIKPIPKSPFEKRAQWLRKAVIQKLTAAQVEIPDWKLPQVDAGVISSGWDLSEDTWGPGWQLRDELAPGYVPPNDEIWYDEDPNSTFTIPPEDQDWYDDASEWLGKPFSERKLKMATKFLSQSYQESKTDPRGIQEVSDSSLGSSSEEEETGIEDNDSNLDDD